MGWGHCGTDDQGREIGYAIDAECDRDGCRKLIDRGLSYVCGGMHGGGDLGCGRYFCGEHLRLGKGEQLCQECFDEAPDLEEEEAT